MAYYETKVYFDGSHYIAIPYKANSTAKKGGEMNELALDEKKEAFEKAYKEIRGKWKKKAFGEIEVN